jgi:hypothetical protein
MLESILSNHLRMNGTDVSFRRSKLDQQLTRSAAYDSRRSDHHGHYGELSRTVIE